jgi:hypothetical protein
MVIIYNRRGKALKSTGVMGQLLIFIEALCCILVLEVKLVVAHFEGKTVNPEWKNY